jgi:hypothetical protein
MSPTKTELDYASELSYLRTRLAQIEKQIDAETNSAINTLKSFNVVLKVTTLPSSWGNNRVDSNEIKAMFVHNWKPLKKALHLTDDGDSIQVESVTEITHEHT